MALWLDAQVDLGKKDGDGDAKRAVCVGLSLPQYGGKRALTKPIQAGLDSLGRKCAFISYDDFYLTHDAQQKLASENPDNIYVAKRGPAGTHDIELGTQTLQKLINCKEGETVVLPKYDKSAFDGEGDRIDYEKNPEKKIESGPVDLILVDSWMLGHQPVDAVESKAIADNAGMEFVNEQLKNYAQWDELYDAAVLIAASDSNTVLEWSKEEEKAKWEAGASSLSVDELKALGDRFNPCYDAYMENMAKNGIKDQVAPERTLGFKLDKGKEPVVDGAEASVEMMTRIGQILVRSTAKIELLEYLS